MEQFLFGKKVKNIRDSKRISQESMAARLGISQSSYWNLENSSHLPENQVIWTIANFLETDVREITPEWWQEELDVEPGKLDKGYMLSHSGHLIYIILLFGFGFEVYTDLVENPLRVPLRMMVVVSFVLIYFYTVKRKRTSSFRPQNNLWDQFSKFFKR
jgi:transcriptional regulator with XRE-family HTH domain